MGNQQGSQFQLFSSASSTAAGVHHPATGLHLCQYNGCDTSAYSAVGLKNHVSSHTREHANNPNNPNSPNNPNNPNSPNMCILCGYTCQGSLDTHMQKDDYHQTQLAITTLINLTSEPEEEEEDY